MAPRVKLLYKHNLSSEVDNNDQTVITLITDYNKIQLVLITNQVHVDVYDR